MTGTLQAAVLRNRLQPFTILLCVCYMGTLLLLTVANHLGPERWWWSGLNMYLPQWVWGIPAIVLLSLTAVAAPRWICIPIASLLVVAFPLMGFHWAAPQEAAGVPIRAMTYNVQLWARPDIPSMASEIAAARPDILCLQDARGALSGRLTSVLKGWNVTAFGQYVIASRFPIAKQWVGDISYDGQKHTYLRADVDVDGQNITVATAHFLTPRDPLSAFRSIRRWPDGVTLMRANLGDRLAQARALADDLRDANDPLIVTGDLNAPSKSLVVRTLADIGLRDAFMAGGRGYGYTFGHSSKLRHSFIRIDQILVSDHFRVIHVTTGSARGSDHRPVIADLRLTR